MKLEKYRVYEEYMRKHMLDSAHDAGHIQRVLGMALLLARKEEAVDNDVLIASALLHDVGREEQFRTGESHAIISARVPLRTGGRRGIYRPCVRLYSHAQLPQK